MTAACSVLLVLAVSPAAPVPKEADSQFTKDVQAAREKAIDYLKKQQTPRGDWEGIAGIFLKDMDGGATALVALALLEGGVPANDTAILKAVEYLAELPLKKTYVVSLQTQVLARVDVKKHAKLTQRNVDWLVKNAIRSGGEFQGWSYPGNNVADGSNTHFAVFALHAAAGAGARVDAKLWDEIGAMYVRTALKDGWSYHQVGRPEATQSMTLAALCGLTIVKAHVKDSAGLDKAFGTGWDALVRQAGSPGKSEGYKWHATAELGRLTGKPVFTVGKKEIAWYVDGAVKLVKDQKPDGSWVFGASSIDNVDLYTTAVGLYFLGPPKR